MKEERDAEKDMVEVGCGRICGGWSEKLRSSLPNGVECWHSLDYCWVEVNAVTLSSISATISLRSWPPAAVWVVNFCVWWLSHRLTSPCAG